MGYLAFLTELVYGVTFDGALKLALRAGDSVGECMEHAIIAERMKEIHDVVPTAAKEVQSISADADLGDDAGASSRAQSQTVSSSPYWIALNVSSAAKSGDVRVRMRLNAMDDEEKTDLRYYMTKAQQILANGVELIKEQPRAKSLAEAIRNTSFGKVRGTCNDDGNYVAIFYTYRMAAESTSSPNSRLPPLRISTTLPGGNHYKKSMQGVINSRLPADSDGVGDELHEGDVFVIPDGGKHGLATQFSTAFVNSNGHAMQKTAKVLVAHYDEEASQLVIPLCIWVGGGG